MNRRASLDWVSLLPLCFGALLAACGGSAAPETAKAPVVPAEVVAESNGKGETPEAKPAEAKRAEGGGLAHAENDKAITDVAKKLLACKWENKGYMPFECDEPRDAWDKLELDKQGKTLVRFLEDKDDRVRFLGAEGLSEARDWRTDKALAAAVLDVLEKNPSNEVYTLSLAEAAGRIDVAATGNEDRVRKLLVGYPNARARRALIHNAQFSNRDVFFETVLAFAKGDQDAEIRETALSAFWVGTPNDKNEVVCALWLEKTKDASEEVATKAAYLAGFNPSGCAKEYDALVKLFDEKTKGKVANNNWTSSIKFMAGNDKVPEKNRKALAAIGKRIAEKKDNEASARADGLRAVAAADPKGAKAYAARFQKDPEKWVKETADEIVKKKDE